MLDLKNLQPTESTLYTFPELTWTLDVRVDIYNKEDGFARRLVVKVDKNNLVVGEWTTGFQTFAVVKYEDLVFMLATEYWAGAFPVETPFEVVTGLKA